MRCLLRRPRAACFALPSLHPTPPDSRLWWPWPNLRLVSSPGAPYEYKTVDLHNKSDEFVALYRKVVADDTANAKVRELMMTAGVCHSHGHK